MPYKDPADQLAAGRRWREANRGRHAEQTRRAKLLQKYGLSIQDFVDLLSSQDGRCAICRALEPGGRGSWHVDHDHDTKKVRGLLCSRCNRGIGLLRDDPVILRAAAEYVETHSGPRSV